MTAVKCFHPTFGCFGGLMTKVYIGVGSARMMMKRSKTPACPVKQDRYKQLLNRT